MIKGEAPVAEAEIPVDLFNPGQVFACLGFLEAADILVGDAEGGLEVLLLRRARSAGFVPGAYVFPGGRVDGADAGTDLLERLDGLTPVDAERRLEPVGPDPPGIAYYLAALREAFEETGILVAHDADGEHPRTAAEDEATMKSHIRASSHPPPSA